MQVFVAVQPRAKIEIRNTAPLIAIEILSIPKDFFVPIILIFWHSPL